MRVNAELLAARQIVETADALLILKARGVLANVWIDGGQVRVSFPTHPCGETHRLHLDGARVIGLINKHESLIAAEKARSARVIAA